MKNIKNALSLKSKKNLTTVTPQSFGVKKVKAPTKNPKKYPIIYFATDKKIISRTFKKQRNIGIFMSQRER
jgi:hypothetical protein